MRWREVLGLKGSDAANRAVIEAEHGELAQWQVLPLTPGREVFPGLWELGASGEFGTTSAWPEVNLAELLRKTVVIADAAAMPSAIGPPDG